MKVIIRLERLVQLKQIIIVSVNWSYIKYIRAKEEQILYNNATTNLVVKEYVCFYGYTTMKFNHQESYNVQYNLQNMVISGTIHYITMEKHHPNNPLVSTSNKTILKTSPHIQYQGDLESLVSTLCKLSQYFIWLTKHSKTQRSKLDAHYNTSYG